LECAIQRKHGERVQHANKRAPRPRLAARMIEQMTPGAPAQENRGQEKKTEKLEIERDAECTDGSRSKTRQKIGAAPGESCCQPKQDAHGRLRRLAFFHLQPKLGHDFLQIPPDFALRCRISEKISRMVSCNKFSAAKLLPFTAKMRN